MKLSVFTDEINRLSSARAIELAADWGMSHVEVRILDSGRFPRVPDTELEEFQRRLADAGLIVSAVSPGLFKCPLDDGEVEPGLRETLPRACEWARRWGTDMVSCFGFRRGDGGEPPAEVIDLLNRMADVAAGHGCRLLLENEAVCWGDTGLEAAAILRQCAADNLSLCWDPGNAARAGSAAPFPDEYRQLRDLVSHVHVKNFDADAGQWSLVETGVVDWPGQLQALADDGFEGFAVIETHTATSPDELETLSSELEPLEANTCRNLHYVRSLLGLTSGDPQ